MRRILVLGLSLSLAACGLFSRSQSRFFSLERVAPAGPIVNAPGIPIGIDTLELPPGFDRREIVVRTANQQVEVRGNHQWSAPFQPLVMHTLAFDLAARLPEGMIILPGAAKPLGPTRAIDVVFEELAAGPESTVVLDARWTLRESGRADVAHRERIIVDVASLDSANIASGVSRALGMLADRMASQFGVR
jgi:hypothetical protein